MPAPKGRRDRERQAIDLEGPRRSTVREGARDDFEMRRHLTPGLNGAALADRWSIGKVAGRGEGHGREPVHDLDAKFPEELAPVRGAPQLRVVRDDFAVTGAVVEEGVIPDLADR